jgi:hypothetical protein
MSNNFDLRKFLTENKLTSVAKIINEAAELSPIEQELVNAVIGDVNEAIDLGKILNKVKLLASKGLLTVAMASAILASCGTAGSSDEIFKRELDNLKKVDSIENVQKTRIDSISNDIKSNPTTATIAPVNELHGGYLEVMGDEFHIAAKEIAKAWSKWKNGPATEPEDIEPARQDVLDFLKSMVP